MGFDFKAPPLGTPPTEYMQEYARQRKAWLADRVGFDSIEAEDGTVQLVEREKVEKERKVTVLQPKAQITESELPLAAKRVYKAAVGLGLEAKLWLIIIEFAPVLYVHDGEDHNAGDVRYEGYVARRYTVEARLPDQPLGFQATYIGKGREGKTGPFATARVRDPYGIPVENWVDYTVDKTTAQERGWTEEQRIQFGMAMNNRINDGSTRLEYIRYFRVGGDFTRWLDEYLEVKGLSTLTPKRKPKQTAEERESAMLSGEDWS